MGFLLTEDGKHQVARVRKALERQIKIKPTRRILKGKERNFVAYLKSTELYQSFRNDKYNFDLTEQDFIDILRGTLETPKRVLRQTLSQYKNLAEEISDIDLQEFLLACEDRMRRLLKD